MITVLIADDEALVRDGLRAILEVEMEFEVVGEAQDGEDAIKLVSQLRPQVVLMDIRMPKTDGLEATKQIMNLYTETKIIILTTFDQNEYVYRAMRAGASAFLLKDVRRKQLTDAIRGVASGELLIAPTTVRRLIEEFCNQPLIFEGESPLIAGLTSREVDVLRQIGRGRSNSEIAQDLFIAETTVKTHITRILFKSNLRDRAQAVVLAYESGLVRTGD